MAGKYLLVGSGEFTPAMLAIDREVLASFGKRRPTVAVVPLAAGQEPSMDKWIKAGERHFKKLGAQTVAVPARNRRDAIDPKVAELVRDADLIYFSGGRPDYLYSCLVDSLLYSAVQERLRHGAMVAGASAGMMIMGDHFLANPYGMFEKNEPPIFVSGLGVFDEVIFIAHFDTTPDWLGKKKFDKILAAIPRHLTVVGVDEDTALVPVKTGWVVRGRGRVVIRAKNREEIFRVGHRLTTLKI